MADVPREIVEVGIDEHGRVTATVGEICSVRDEWALVVGRSMVALLAFGDHYRGSEVSRSREPRHGYETYETYA